MLSIALPSRLRTSDFRIGVAAVKAPREVVDFSLSSLISLTRSLTNGRSRNGGTNKKFLSNHNFGGPPVESKRGRER